MIGARVVEVTSAVSTMWDLGSRLDLKLVLHVDTTWVAFRRPKGMRDEDGGALKGA
jgi:hypothetical protein